MASEENGSEFNIGSRVSLKTAVAIGCTVTVGLFVYLLIGPIFQKLGRQAPSAYALTIFFFFLIILTIAERGSGTRGGGGLYSLSRSNDEITIAFGTGWALLGGLTLLAAIFAYLAGLALSQILSQLYEIDLTPPLFGAISLLISLPRQLIRSSSPWRKRTTILYGTILVLLIFIVAIRQRPLTLGSAYSYLPSELIFSIAPLMIISLWSVQLILDHRSSFRPARQALLFSLFLPLIIGSILGTVLSWILLQYSTLIINDNFPLVTLGEQIHPLIALFLLIAMGLLGFIGINESLSSLIKLSSAISRDGYLPNKISLPGRHITPQQMVLLIAVPVVLLVLWYDQILSTVEVSTILLLSAIILINARDIFRTKIRLPENRAIHLPLHPLIPVLAVAISATGIFVQTLDSLVIGLAWFTAGGFLFFFYAREGAVSLRREKDIVGVPTIPNRKSAYRILAAISNPDAAEDLIRFSRQITVAYDGQLTLLHVHQAPEIDDAANYAAQEKLSKLKQIAEHISQTTDLDINPIVRISPAVATGIINTLWEEQIDSVILGWPLGDIASPTDGTVSRLVRNVQAQVIVLHGAWPESIKRVLVPNISENHSAAALNLAQKISIQGDQAQEIVSLQVVSGKLNEKNENLAYKQINHTLSKLQDPTSIQRQITAASTSKEAILAQVDEYDLLLMGLSDEGFLAPTLFGGLAVDVARNVSIPVLLIAGKEKFWGYLLRRFWDQLTDFIPSLTSPQQTTVGSSMTINAKSSIDFHVLTSLATAIAFLGLIQNSAAVIIGAMLVAPLMNPILAMAFGIVRGRFKMLREASNTTLNGVIISITISLLITLILLVMGFPISPTTEILARTEPNFLDLLVALASGAVAAYAVSRSEVAGALPGVAIAAALVPPLAVVGYGLGTVQFSIASGSLLLFLTNLAAIVFAAAIVFLLLGFRPPSRIGRDEQARFGLRISLISLLIIAIPLIITSAGSSRQANRDATIVSIVQGQWAPSQADVTNIVILDEDDDVLVNVTILDYTGSVTEESLAMLQSKIAQEIDEEVILDAQIVNASLKRVDSTRAAQELTVTPSVTAESRIGTPTPTGTTTRSPSETAQP